MGFWNQGKAMTLKDTGKRNFALWDFGIKAKPRIKSLTEGLYFALWDFGIKAKPDMD